MRPFFLVITIVLINFILVSCDELECQVYFRGDLIKEQTLSFIKDALYSLDICVYSINDPDIINALTNRAENGVRVRICTDNAYPLLLDKVKIVYDSQGLMHNKYMIADSSKVWFGSTNLTQTSLEEHENNIIISHDKDLILTFQQNFDQCLSGLFKTSRKGMGSQLIRFSPEENCFEFILDELSHAKRSVYIAMFAFSDNRIAHYLKVLSSKGVQIFVLADKDWNLSSVYSDTDEMSKYSRVRLDVSDALLHEKFIIIDENVLLTGSYNYTASAQSRNDEFVFKTKDVTIVNEFTRHFLSLWEESDPRLQAPVGN